MGRRFSAGFFSLIAASLETKHSRSRTLCTGVTVALPSPFGADTPSPAPKADPPPLPLAEAQEKAQSFRRRKLSYDTMDPNAITTDGKVDEPDATGSTAEAGSESFAAVKIAIEGESAIVSIDTSPTARSSPAKQHAAQPAQSSPLAG